MRAHFPFWLALLALAGPSAVQAEEELGRLIVKVTETGTGQPVAGAIVDPGTGALEPIDERKHTTDANGRVEIAVPLGNLRLRAPAPPVGFWMAPVNVNRQGFEQVVLTREQPTIERSYEATRGVVWPARVVTRNGQPAEGVRLHPGYNSFRQGGGRGATGQTSAAGICQLTFPQAGGEMWVSCNGAKHAVDFATRRVQLDIAADFDPTQVASRTRAKEGDRITLVDHRGRQASLAGCDAILRDGAAELLFVVLDPPGPEQMGEVVGRVVDAAGQPIADVTVMCNHNAVRIEEFSKRTAADGGFRFRAPFKWSRASDLPSFLLMVEQDGFIRHEEGHLFAPGEDGVFRVEPIVLKRGYAVPVRVLTEDGQPAEGARLSCSVGERIWPKSDRQGLATMQNLPVGEVTVGVQFGDQSGSVKVDVTPAAAAQPPVEIRLKRGAAPLFAPAPRRPAPKPLAMGAAVPPWSIERWTDGKEHTLAELRGRIVVIEFWNVGFEWCHEITLPVSQILETRYSDVAFVRVHSAYAQHHYIKELLALKRWNFVVGFDKGTTSADGETMNRYGVTTAATLILDRDGRVLTNSELRGDRAAEEAKSKAIAAAAGLPWPLEKDASQEELIRRQRRLHEQSMTTEIEKALEAK